MSNALYRKYRPSAFDGVVGQEHIVQTLINQIRTTRVCHAYLFCGSRGVGKTSLARIFARAVNCENKDSNTSLPCGKCEFCRSSMSAESSMDIIEIDAASNNGVDDARELRETVKYLPANGKYRVYIIDEVHMLSTAAFNALLKTLEEPPAHAVFILATTEAHKLPATVLSRCVRFDFRLIAASTLFKLLSKIFEAEGKDFEEDALRAIASAAEGSVRDALSIADMCINLSAGKLTAREVKELIGGEDEKIESLLLSISRSDVKGALKTLSEMAGAGMSMTICCKQLALTARDIMAVKLDESLLSTTLSRHDRLKNMGAELSVSFLAAAIELFITAENNLRYALSPILSMEAAIIRACRLYSLDLNAIDERLNRFERALSGGTVVAKSDIPSNYIPPNNPPNGNEPPIPPLPPMNMSEPPQMPAPPPVKANEPPLKMSEQPPRASEQPQEKPEKPKEITAIKMWGRLITFFRKNSTPKMFAALSNQNPERINLSGNTLTIYANKDNFLFFCDDAFKEEMDRAFLSEGFNLKLIVEKDLSAVDIEKEVESMLNEFGKQKVNIIS